MINLLKLEKEVVEISCQVGGFIAQETLHFDKSKIEHKESFNNLVSYVDKEAERLLVKELSKVLPGSGFLAEEGTSSVGSTDYRWIIDPLDGTTNFTHGLPPYAVSIALAKADHVILGIVYEVTRQECFHATIESPACCNGKPIRVASSSSLNESLLATGFPYYHFDKRDEYLAIIKTFLELSHGVRRMGSAATDLAYVACGRMDGFFEYNLNPWDVAAGALLMEQAGGKVSDFKGESNFLFGGEICAAGAIHEQMLTVIKKNWGYA